MNIPRWRTIFFQQLIPWITVLHILVFLLFWLTNRLFYSSTNDYLANLLGRPADYISILLGLSLIVGAWAGARLFRRLNGKTAEHDPIATGLFMAVAVIYLAFFYGSFSLLFKESPIQLPRILQMVGYFRLILDTALLVLAALMIGLNLRKGFLGFDRGSFGRFPLSTWLGGLVFVGLWLMPVLFPPASVYKGSLPPRPLVIAHRGASMLAPENTLISMEKAANLGVYGVETDIHISQDGIAYLMHDDTLNRTTNVREVFPGRQKNRAESFTLAEIRKLNAGKWFVDQDPFGVIARRLVSPADILQYQEQSIPTLAEELEIVRDNHLQFIFDLKRPPAGNPYTDRFFTQVLDQIHQAGIDDQVWFLVDREQLAVLRSEAPKMIPAAGIDDLKPPAVDDLESAGYQIVNAEYGLSRQATRAYQSAGMWLNFYTIDEPWQYSRLWLMGINSTTSSNAHVLVALKNPVFAMEYFRYLAVWIVLGLFGLGIIYWMAFPPLRQAKSRLAMHG